MKLHSRLSRAAVDLVVRFETFHAQAQPAAGGGWTIGYGHTRSARSDGRVSRQDAETLLLYDLAIAADAVEASLFAPVNPGQFEALTAFCFNIGADNFRNSTALARVNAGAELEAADEIERWRRAELGAGPQVVDALVRRRAAEKAHFLGLPEGFSKSPRAVLRPLPGAEGQGWEPSSSQGAVASATLSAANCVQARLRELVPEPEPPPFTEEAAPPQAPAELSPIPAPDPEPEPLAILPPASAPEPPAEADPRPPSPPPGAPERSGAVMNATPSSATPTPAPYVAPPPPPPTHDDRVRAANDTVVSTDARDETVEIAPMSASEASQPPGRDGGRVLWPKLTARGVYAVLAALGVALFATAAVLILSGRPTLANLILGICSVGLMTPGVYGLLGPRRLKD